jgi:hypothetical protein
MHLGVGCEDKNNSLLRFSMVMVTTKWSAGAIFVIILRNNSFRGLIVPEALEIDNHHKHSHSGNEIEQVGGVLPVESLL